MYHIKHHTTEVRQLDDGWAVVCDDVALWKGLTFAAAQCILTKLTRGY